MIHEHTDIYAVTQDDIYTCIYILTEDGENPKDNSRIIPITYRDRGIIYADKETRTAKIQQYNIPYRMSDVIIQAKRKEPHDIDDRTHDLSRERRLNIL